MNDQWASWGKYVLKSIENITLSIKSLEEHIIKIREEQVSLRTKFETEDFNTEIQTIKDEILLITNKIENLNKKVLTNKIKLAIVISASSLIASGLLSFIFSILIKKI